MSRRGPLHHCLAVCAPGLEALTAKELLGLGTRVRRTLIGGVEFSASARQLYAANRWLRTATRVVVRVAPTFVAHNWTEMEAALAAMAWDRWIADGTTPAVRVSTTASQLFHTEAVAERVVEAAARGRVAGVLIVVRIVHDRVTLSIDSSGEALYRRGWRLATAKAPMRETLAAAMLLSSGWDGASPLLDPCCGSGTIAIEAAQLALGVPPGGQRRFAFQAWPSFEPGTWASVTADRGPRPSTMPPILGADRDPIAIRAALANAARAGVAEHVQFVCSPVATLRPPKAPTGWVLSNPPYGRRLGSLEERAELYREFERLIRRDLGGWDVGLLVADDHDVAPGALELQERLRTTNGGIKVRFLVGRC